MIFLFCIIIEHMEYFMHLEKSHFQKIEHGVKKYEIWRVPLSSDNYST